MITIDELPQGITIENICEACESRKKPCPSPCRLWYKLLDRKDKDDKME
jgi:hypothetical protein